jgi:hypothetical protein
MVSVCDISSKLDVRQHYVVLRVKHLTPKDTVSELVAHFRAIRKE